MAFPSTQLAWSDMRAALSNAGSNNVTTVAFSQMRDYLVDLPGGNAALSASVLRGVQRRALDAVPPTGNARNALACAWSTRQVRGAYAGPVMQVRREVDGATSNLFADSNDRLWTAPNAGGEQLAAFLAGSPGFVAAWYDQVGSNHATQAEASNQPQVQLDPADSNLCSVMWSACNQRLDMTFPAAPRGVAAQLRLNSNAWHATQSAHTVLHGPNDTRWFLSGASNVFGDIVLGGNNELLGTPGSFAYVDGAFSQLSNDGVSVMPVSNAQVGLRRWAHVVGARASNVLPSAFTRIGADVSIPFRGLRGELRDLVLYNSTGGGLTSNDGRALAAVSGFVPYLSFPYATFPSVMDAAAAFARRLTPSAAAAPSPIRPRIGALQCDQCDYVLRGGSVTLASAGDVDALFTATKDVAPAFVLVDGDLTINAGVSLRPAVRKLFTVLYVTGNLVNNGEISMTARGANHSGTGDSGGFVAPVDLLVGASAAPVGALGGAGALLTGSTVGVEGGTGASAGSGGGGGTGAAASAPFTGSYLRGAAGTCFSGGPGSASIVWPSGTLFISEGGSNGGAGGAGRNSGAGNPGGANGTGGTLIVIVQGVLSGSGTLTSAGAAGENGVGGVAAVGGGGSGGGSIVVVSGSNSGSVAMSVPGGPGGTGTGSTGINRNGGAGGAGSVRALTLLPAGTALYPPVALSGANVTLAGPMPYGAGAYAVTASTESLPRARAFDRDASTWWQSAEGVYALDGSYNSSVTTTISGAAYAGEWLQLQLPNTVQLQSYSVRPSITEQNDGPRNFVLAGSSNSSTWVLLDSRSNVQWGTGERALTFSPANTSNGPFNQYRLCVNGAAPAANALRVAEFSVRGVGTTASTFAGVEYPPAALTGSNVTLSGLAYGNGAYVTSASKEFSTTNEASHLAFDRVWTSAWAGGVVPANSTYTSPDGLYTGANANASTVIDGAAYAGEWLQIQLPSAVRLTGYTLATIQGSMEATFWSRGPRDFVLAGSADGVTWTAVDTRTGVTDWREAPTLFTVSSNITAAYPYYRLCVNRIAGWYWLSIREMRLFGA